MIERLESFLTSLSELTEKIQKVRTSHVTKSTMRSEVAAVTKVWLDSLSVQLRAEATIPEALINDFDGYAEEIRELSKNSSRRSTYVKLCTLFYKRLQQELLVPLIKNRRTSPTLIQGVRAKFFALPLTDGEKVYYDEAFRAAEAACYKAGIVMLWCGAISRLQTFVRKKGLSAFNAASVKAHGIKSGPYKYFNKEYNFSLDGELQTIPDADLIVVISAMVDLDVGKTEALLSALDTRNTCGHPSTHSMEEIHFAHFGTEIYNLVLNEPKL